MQGFPFPAPARDFPSLYEELLWRLMRQGSEELNERTGKRVKVYPYGGASFTLDMSGHELPVVGRRRLYPATAAAETAWYLLGTQDPTFMMRHAKVVWEKFLEDNPDQDAGASASKIIKAAYGYRWRKHFGRDQLQLAMDALDRNPSDRRVFISAWDPAEDGLGAQGQLNVPCPVGFTFSVLDGRLNSTYLLRSSDVFVGLPYDVMGHALLMAAVGETIGVQLGFMTFTLAHPHIYDVHYAMADEFILQTPVKPKIMLPRWTVDQIVGHPDAYVEKVRKDGNAVPWPDFAPRPEVVQ